MTHQWAHAPDRFVTVATVGTIEDILAVAPDDVADMLRWLLGHGASVVHVVPRHGMGFALAELALGDLDLRVLSDRDQWSLEL